MKYTIITGNPLESFKCFGIFETDDAAVAHASADRSLDPNWQIMPIHPIEAGEIA